MKQTKPRWEAVLCVTLENVVLCGLKIIFFTFRRVVVLFREDDECGEAVACPKRRGTQALNCVAAIVL